MPSADRDKRREASRRYYWAHREVLLEKQAKYRDANRERLREAGREFARQYLKDNRDAVNARLTLRRHGLRPEDRTRMLDAQGGCCYLCGDDLTVIPGRPVVDHDHSCCPGRTSCAYCRRGIACDRCNMLIGLADEDPERLRRITDNLEAARLSAQQRMTRKPAQPELSAS